VIQEADFDYFKDYSFRSAYATSDMYWAGESRKRAFKNAYAYKNYKKAGVIALGTDFPVEEVNNVDFHAAVARTVKGISAGFRWKMH
jgi:predicted amidohydrolase YtcJ